MDPEVSEDDYRPPEISDIDAAEDREFFVVGGADGSGIGGRN